ncbi:hypothetical protein FB451DRAFT_1248474 [Mycena latifolia]|nr:hypothetical protein FB451DRAFT_1248474 [Mycena latifolia]
MPTRTSPRRTRSSALPAPGPSKAKAWRATAPEPAFDDDDAMDSDATADDDENVNSALGHPRHLDDPWAYTFQPNDRVWIRNHDKWIKGRIFPRSVPKLGSSDNLTYWNVLYQDSFGHKLRKYFSPLLGELKPDTSAVRGLLREAHWL